MEQIVVKTEVQPNGEILLFNFYVDESQNGEANEEDPTTITAEQYLHSADDIHKSKFIITEIDDSENINEIKLVGAGEDGWSDDELRKLLIFYTDNKEAFLSGTTERKYLWDVACKTMLRGKHHSSCELKLKSMMKKYAEVIVEKRKGAHIMWPYFATCHEAFYDNNEVKIIIDQYINDNAPVKIKVPPVSRVKEDGIFVNQKPPNPSVSNEKVELMLNLYLKHRRKFQRNESQRGLWELIVLEMGEQDVDYWHRRFLNYKQHYTRMLHKQNESGVGSITWPYMKIFDEIFKNDEEFHKKWSPQVKNKHDNKEQVVAEPVEEMAWSDMEKTFLVKYFFDCFHEFQDVTIPNMFLWTEVGRLLDKKAVDCKEKFAEIKDEHINALMKGGYDLTNRLPVEIILDNIIAKEVEIQLQRSINTPDQLLTWAPEKVDELVNYLYENTEMLKDPVCYNICWYILGKKCNLSPTACKNQWDELIKLYKSMLNDKKENPDMTIDWRYMDLFDRIFDYGMATDLLDGPEKLKFQNEMQSSKVGVKKITIKDPDDNNVENGVEDEEIYDERGFMKHSKKQPGDTKAFKILEFYLKHKNKFMSSQGKRVTLWDPLSKEIGISATECAHRFRNFKQVYRAYVKREISKPEKPIVWPYYALCKKVFGYRSIKNKIKNELQTETDDEDWSAKDIKTLINFFARNFNDLQDKIGESDKWMVVANQLGRSSSSCSDKFMELRKSYRKLRTMKSRNPHVKVSWKYFNLMNEIYNSDGARNLEETVETIEVEDEQSVLYNESNIKQDLQDEDYTIIVIPEGEEFSNTQYIIPDNENIITEFTEGVESYIDLADVKKVGEKVVPKWTKRTKKRLLILYLNYLRAHKGKEIKPKDMWTEIASKFGDRKPITCKKMFIKLKERHKKAVAEDTVKSKIPYFTLFEKILSLKPKYARNQANIGQNRTYKDYPIEDTKVELALKYYLQNIDEFVSPKFEKKYLWTELANYISEPVSKVFNKVNYLIQFYKSNTLEAENTRFGEVLKEIFIKENLLNDVPMESKTVEEVEYSWTDDEIETLLTWYLAHLEKFKNPKFVRSYLWMEASDILKKSPWACSNKMSDIRTQYRTMVKENPEGLNTWRFATLCQRIYGTGKRNNPPNVN